MNIDYSVYPDQELVSLDTDEDKADYLHSCNQLFPKILTQLL